jgi:hypothetical protein
MEYGILGQLDFKIIFNYKRSRIHLFLLQIFKYFLNHAISFVAFATTMYSTSIVEYVGTEYLCDIQDTIVDPRLMI